MGSFFQTILDIPVPNLVLGGVAIVGAVFFSTLIVSNVTYKEETKYDSEMSEDEEYKEEEYKREARELKHRKASYGQKWFDELENLEDRNLTNEELVDLRNKIIREDTPEGEILMYYNSDTESFWYFSNTKNISNRTLDAVARKYSITHNCKQVCINHRAEIANIQNKICNMLYNVNDNTKDNAKDNATAKDSTDNTAEKNKPFNIEDVFVKPKITKKKLIKRHRRVIVDRVNRFTYKGKLNDYKTKEEIESEKKPVNPKQNMTFQEYKKVLEDMQKKSKLE